MEWSERIGRRIRLRDLHILLAVVQCKSLAKAADHLAISRPVISKAIADLEQVLGVRLIERDRHGAEPTPYGAALLKRGIAVFDELRSGVKDIEFLSDPAAGEVRIGSTAPLSATRVPDEVAFEALYEDPLVVTVGAQSPWARRRKVELAELVDEWWAMPPLDTEPGRFYAELFRAKGLDCPRARVVSFSIGTRASLLSTGRFITFLPLSALRFPARQTSIKALPIELPMIGPVGIATLKKRALSPSAQLFIAGAREVAKQMAR